MAGLVEHGHGVAGGVNAGGGGVPDRWFGSGDCARQQKGLKVGCCLDFVLCSVAYNNCIRSRTGQIDL
jgi:hypothetical protein